MSRLPSHVVASRRRFLQVGAAGLTLPGLLAGRAEAATVGGRGGFGRAKSCIVLFAWGGMSHVDTWDPKPAMSADIRGEFATIPTSVPGIQVGEHMPRLAAEMQHLAVVRSVHHKAAAHREAAYWNITGHAPEKIGSRAIPPSRRDWPCLGSMVSYAKEATGGRSSGPLPGNISLPYPIADHGLVNGQFGGFLGSAHDPVYLRPASGTPYGGKSPSVGMVDLELAQGVTRERFVGRRGLLGELEQASNMRLQESEPVERFQSQAMDMLLSPSVRQAFEVEREPESIRAAYGNHICGQSILLARRLTDAGVPLVTVYCAAGDLNGSIGDHWDTHGDNFNKLKNILLPPFDQGSTALVRDLAQSGKLDDTLVVWMTEFGRTPRVTHAGRDHFPNCYSVAFAGGGVQGGQVYGRSDATGAAPASEACGPEDLHATIFHALGIDCSLNMHDLQGRPLALSAGRTLPIF